MKKKVLTFLLSVSLVFSGALSAAAEDALFTDGQFVSETVEEAPEAPAMEEAGESDMTSEEAVLVDEDITAEEVQENEPTEDIFADSEDISEDLEDTFIAVGENVETQTYDEVELMAFGTSMSSAKNISLGYSYSGSISSSSSSNYYKFTLNSSGRINLTAAAGMYRIYYRIYDSAGNQVWHQYYNWNSTTKESSASADIDLIKGTYYFVAEDNYYTGNYSFKLAHSSAGESFTETSTSNNNSISAANGISLNTTYKGQIALNDENDFYKFTMSSSGKINLSATAGVYRIYYRIYDSTGNQIWSKYYNWNSTTKESSVSEDVDLIKGTYYFVAEDSYYTGNYSFKLAYTNAEESFTETNTSNNNSISAANGISLNTTYKGQIALNDKNDFYKFTMSSSGRINLGATAGMYRIYYRIYDSTGNQIWSKYYNWNSTTKESSVSEDIDLIKGTYYFVAEDSYYTGNYSFKLAYTSAGESFSETSTLNNNSMSTANGISPNTTYKGQVALNDECDFYKFTVSSSGKINLTATAGMYRIYCRIYDSTGKQTWSNGYYWNSTSKESSISKELTLSAGTYYLVFEDSYYTGNYTFKLSTHTHTYKKSVKKATVYSDGKIVSKCSCGAIEKTTTIYYPKTVTLSTTSYTYNGKVKKPSVTVKGRDGKVISSSNYSVTYTSGRKNVGTYKVLVTFKGNYSGKITKTFTIKPKGTTITKLKAKSKGFTVTLKKQTSQTTGYQIQYSTTSSFKNPVTKTILRNSTSSATYSKLKAKKKYYVRIRTYKTVSGKKYYSAWSAAKSVKTK